DDELLDLAEMSTEEENDLDFEAMSVGEDDSLDFGAMSVGEDDNLDFGAMSVGDDDDLDFGEMDSFGDEFQIEDIPSNNKLEDNETDPLLDDVWQDLNETSHQNHQW
ncbi:MAG: hypothetical protein F6K21_34415, partial [Symploca sp. SIO2D2]|nr:hypothetical protein [Symploca sp. SIO2D2]